MVSTRDVLLKVYPFVVAKKTISHPHSLIQKGRKTIFILLVVKLSLDAVLYLIL